MLALSVQNLEKIYKNGVHALKHINLTVEEGDFFALLGPNGAGKTTLIGIISSLVTKNSGKIQVFDKDMDENPELVKSYIGVVPQEFNFHHFDRVDTVLLNQGGYHGLPKKIIEQRAEKYLKQLGLWGKRFDPVRMLSGGMKRRLMIARALIHEPKLLILDEPTAGVDIEIRRTTWEFLRDINQRGITIILTTHYLEEAESLCRNIAIIHHGNVIEHTGMASLLNQLEIETLVFYLVNPLTILPHFSNYSCRLIDEYTLEIDLQKSQSLTQLFTELTSHNIIINRMRNKRNRLEELFVQLIGETS